MSFQFKTIAGRNSKHTYLMSETICNSINCTTATARSIQYYTPKALWQVHGLWLTVGEVNYLFVTNIMVPSIPKPRWETMISAACNDYKAVIILHIWSLTLFQFGHSWPHFFVLVVSNRWQLSKLYSNCRFLMWEATALPTLPFNLLFSLPRSGHQDPQCYNRLERQQLHLLSGYILF